LKVNSSTIFHFRERKLSLDQEISGPDSIDGAFMVKASIANTVLLVPFLLSMLEGIEVISPESIRLKMIEHLAKMVSNYRA
jgi:predicted DNA-binding transcriptional regulator YafY